MSSADWETALGGNKKALDAFRKATKKGASAEDAFNEALARCSTEQERQQLITSTLNQLYADSAEAFNTNNAAVIEAQEATANLNTATANLGEKVELGGTFCMGKCQLGVCVTVNDDFFSVTPDTVGDFFTKEVLSRV